MEEEFIEQGGKVTLQDIATHLGVTKATVSRALKQHPRISKETVTRVQEAAAALGYQPDARINELMRRLRYRRKIVDRPVIAILMHQDFPVGKEPLERKSSISRGTWQQAIAMGFQPEIFNIWDYEKNPDRLSKILYSRGIRGAILSSFQHPQPLPPLNWSHLSLVAVGYSQFSLNVHRCITNHYQGMMEAIRKACELGYRRFSVVFGPVVEQRTHGYYRAAYLLNATVDSQCYFAPVAVVGQVSQKEYAAFLKKEKIEMILCAGSVEWVEKVLGLNAWAAPQDIGLIDLHLLEDSRLSGIWQSPFEVGQAAVDLLVTLIQNAQMGLTKIPKTILVDGEWYEGESTRKIGSPVVPPHVG